MRSKNARRAMSSVHELHSRQNSDTRSRRADSFASRASHHWVLLIATAEFVVVAIGALLAATLYYKFYLAVVPPIEQYAIASLVLGGFFSLICLIDDQYNIAGEHWYQNGISRAAGAIALAFVFLLAVAFLFKFADDYSRGTLISQLALVLPAVIILRAFLVQQTITAVRDERLQGHNVVVLSLAGDDRRSEIAKKLSATGGKIVRWHSLNLDPDRRDGTKSNRMLTNILSEIHAECRKRRVDVMVIIFESRGLQQIETSLEVIYELPLNVHLLPLGLLPFMQGSRIVESGRIRVMEINPQPSMTKRILKRGMDLVIAAIAIVGLSPLLLLVAIAIRLDSPGPAIFRQKRHGFNNEPIEVLKFRTMVVGNGKFRQATKSDPRLTRIGAILRRTNIDELPQLFNVLRGDMSLVGPRPHPVELNEAYAAQIKWMYRRHNVIPGITGWAQVNGFRGVTDTPDKMLRRVEYDLYYIDNQSFFFDLTILLLTMFSKKAYRNAH
jgi:Undecaprenyl-phosphate glucose phosphotransferase